MEIDKLIARKSLSGHCCQSLCLLRLSTLHGEMRGDPNATWMKKIKLYSQNNYLKELNRIDGMQTEFEWKISTGFTTLGILEDIQKIMKSIQCEPEHSTIEPSSCQCLITFYGEKTTIQKNVIRILLKLGNMLTDFIAVIGLSWDMD